MAVGAVIAPCSICGRPLPEVRIEATTTADGTVALAPDLSRSWRGQARLLHPRCFGGRDEVPLQVAA